MSELVERIADAIERVTVERQGQGFHLVTGRNDSEAFARAALSVLEPRIEAAVMAERERCARIAERASEARAFEATLCDDREFVGARLEAADIAAAIRNGEAEQ